MWQRTLLRTPDGDDTTTFVRYLQTPSVFADLRIPAARPAGLGGRPLDTLDDDALAALAMQQGFAGEVTVDGRVCTWQRWVDYQPPGPSPDVGRCEPDGDGVLLEHGVHASYLERWERLADGGGPVLALERGGPPRELLVVVGDHFLHVRDRRLALPAGSPSLAAACRNAPPAVRRAWLDCALSWGRVQGAASPWQVLRSTVPELEGRPLLVAGALRPSGDGLQIRKETGGTEAREWAVREGGEHVTTVLEG